MSGGAGHLGLADSLCDNSCQSNPVTEDKRHDHHR